jgi:Tol biopolymer transport system component
VNARRHGTVFAAVVAAVLIGAAAPSLATTWSVQPFVNTSANEYFAVWSPDAQQLAYVSDATGVRQLYIVNADGTGTWQVTNDANGVFDAAWSPNGQYLVYTQSQMVPKDLIMVQLNAARDGVVGWSNLTNDPYTATWKDARFSPNGQTIIANRQYSSSWQIAQVEPSGGWTLLTGTYSTVPAWKPDGSLVAYARSGSTTGVTHIYVNYLPGDVKLVDWGITNLKIRGLAWSPLGTQLAFSAPYESVSYVGVVNANGSNLVVLDSGPAAFPQQAYATQEDVWSADGTKLVYSAYEGGVWNVYTINADGTGKELVSASTGDDLRARFFGDGRICFESDRSGNWDIYVTAPPVTNQPPVAEANGPYIVPATSWDGAEVVLDGSASSDPDGDPLLYSWRIGGVEIGTDPVITHQFPIGLTEGVTLTVSDPSGETDTAETTVTVTVIPVTIDIKPGADPNNINLGSNGAVPVAFLTDETFDAATIDPLTITLAGHDFYGLVKMRGKKNAEPQVSLVDVDGDGDLDLLAHLETENLALEPTATVCTLGALTYSGEVVQGEDSVNIVGN